MSKTKDTSTKGSLIFLGVVVGIGAAIGALTGWGLSFTVLPLFMIGGIVAAVPTILFAAVFVCVAAQDHGLNRRTIFELFSMCVAGIVIGVGLAAASSAIFPGVMLGMGSAALAVIGASAVIGAIAPITGFIISSICFSSKGNQPHNSLSDAQSTAGVGQNNVTSP